MPGPALAPISMASGSMASPTQGQGGLMDILAQSLGSAYQRQLQLQKQQQEAATYQASEPLRQALAQRIRDNPELAHDPTILKQAAAMYRGTGISAPMTGMPETTPGTAMMNSTIGKPPGSVSTHVEGMQQGMSNALPRASLGPMQISTQAPDMTIKRPGLNADELGGPLSVEQQKVTDSRQKDFRDQWTKTFDNVVKSGNPAQVQAAVEQWQRQAPLMGLDPNEMNAYLSPAIESLSPLQASKLALNSAKIGEDSAMTHSINAMLQPKIEELNAQTAERDAMTTNLKTIAQHTQAILRGTDPVTAARIRQIDSTIERNTHINGLEDQEASWYARRVNSGQFGGGVMGENAKALSSMLSSQGRTQTFIKGLSGEIAQIQSSIGYMENKPALDAQIDQIQGEISVAQQQYNEQGIAIQTLGAQMGIPVGMANFGSTFGANGSVTQPPPVQAQPKKPSTMTYDTMPKTKMNPKDHKLWHLWRKDLMYHEAPE